MIIFMAAASSRARGLMNEEINYFISILPEISTMFRSPRADLTSLGITTESDFMVGAVWASCTSYFNFDFRLRYLRRHTDEEFQEALQVLYDRAPEIRQGIREKVGL
jgi:hypothetical protein